MDDLGSIKDTTKLIWEYYFKVRFSMLEARSIDHIKLLGVNISGNKDVDNDAYNELTVTYMTIDKMVDYFKQGVTIRVVNYDDTKTIYEYITLHLSAWKQQLYHGVNIGNAPVEDLLAMDYFASAIYEHAKYTLVESLPDSIAIRYASSLQSINPMNFFNKQYEKNLKTEAIEYPERESYSNFFQERTIVNRRY